MNKQILIAPRQTRILSRVGFFLVILLAACGTPAGRSEILIPEPFAGAMIVYPRESEQLHVGDFVDVAARIGDQGGLSASTLLVNDQPLRRDPFLSTIENGMVIQPWIPSSPGVYVLQMILESGAGGQHASNRITVYVSEAVAKEEITPEPVEEKNEEPESNEEECPQPIATTLSFANCRSGPGTGYNLIAGLKPGESFPLIGRIASGSWWQVQRGGGSCWLWSNLISICGDTQAVPLSNMLEKDEVMAEEPEKEEKPDPTLTPTWDPSSGPTSP